MRTSSSILIRRRVVVTAFAFVAFTITILLDGSGSVYGFLLVNNINKNIYAHHSDRNHRNGPILQPELSRCRVHRLDSSIRTSENNNNNNNEEEDRGDNKRPKLRVLQSRDVFLRTLQLAGVAATTTAINPVTVVRAFEGGVGGLGKTKPETGVQLFDDTSAPIQNEKGIVSSEIKGTDGSPILVSFQTPWPLLPTSGALEARDIRSTESAFVQVVSLSSISNNKKWKDKKDFQRLLMESVFAAQGKFGAYGQPYDIQAKRVADQNANENESNNDDSSIFVVTFTSLTPAMRESERKALVAARQVGADTLVLLVVTTTTVRYPSNEKIFRSIASSFEVVAAPESSLNKRSSSSK